MHQLPPFIGEPAEVYRSRRREFLTSHQLIDYTHCPLLYKQKQAGLVAETIGEHYLLGSATHCLTLEGRQEFERQFVVGGPINPKTDRPFGRDTKAYEAWAAEQGKPCLSDDQFALCCQLASAVKSHKLAASLLNEGVAEGVLRVNYGGVPCQIRVDWFHPTLGIVDLKTCENLDNFEADAAKYHYVQQMAFYRAVLGEVTGDYVPVSLIAVEKREPYRVGVWTIAIHDLLDAEEANCRAICELRMCRQSNTWPTRYEDLRTLAA